MKILFLQEFALDCKYGGPKILSRLVENAPENVLITLSCDTSYKKYAVKEHIIHFSLPKNFRFGIGRLVSFIEIFCLHPFTILSIIRIIRKVNPNVVHITAHGPLFPAYMIACIITNRRIFLSLHDVWHESIKGFAPKCITDILFKLLVKRSEHVYVICENMGAYIRKKFNINKYTIITDGIKRDDAPIELSSSYDEKILSFLYIGNLYGKQYKALNTFVDILSRYNEHVFKIGFCTEYDVNLYRKHENIKIINYGWKTEIELRSICQEYKFGLLPLSFSKKDKLFYMTSFMTKIISYLFLKLPIVCIGPEYSSANDWIRDSNTGFNITALDDGILYDNIRELINTDLDTYKAWINSIEYHLINTFSIEKIAVLFYEKMNYNAGITI